MIQGFAQFFIVLLVNKSEVANQLKLIVEFTCRTRCDIQESRQLLLRSPTAALGYIHWYGIGCSAYLACESVHLVLGKSLCGFVDFQRQLVGFLPGLDVPEVLHEYQLSAYGFRRGEARRCASVLSVRF